jgi:putative membrane protein
VEDGDLRIESGVIRRQSLRFPLAQVQAIDIVRPGLARVFGLAELRLRMGGSTGGKARLAYLHEHEAEPLRAYLLASGSQAEADEHVSAPEPVEESVLTTVPTGLLISSIVLGDTGVGAMLALAALIVAATLAPATAAGLLGSGVAVVLGVFSGVWRRFNQEYRLTVTESADGLHVRGGLVALTAETIRPGRVQGARLVEPFIWRRLGWCRLEVDLAGRQRSKGEGRAQRARLRAVLPVGSRAQAEALLDRIVPDRPGDLSKPPRRVWWKSPLRYRMLAAGHTDRCVVTTTGRIRRVTCWVPMEKAQSIRWVQGPLQRRMRLASLHLDTAGRSMHAALWDRDVQDADRMFDHFALLARRARAQATVAR